MSRNPKDLFLTIFLMMTVLIPSVVTAADSPALVFQFADDEGLVTLTAPNGKALPTVEGTALAPGSRIVTGSTTAEFRLVPNGSILKLARNTVFEVRALATGAGENAFTLAAGRLRMVAAKVVGAPGSYSLKTPTAQAGVRGTDFALEANADTGDWICVKQGAVEFAPQGKPAAAILVKAGEFANVKMDAFAPKKASAADIAEKFSGLDFVRGHEDQVPGHTKG